MGITRNGARTFLTVGLQACRLSHIPGFRAGLNKILSPTVATELWGFWEPFCQYLESLAALDDYFNKRDATLPDTAEGDEDGPFG